MKVSVVIASFNARHTIGATLVSLQRQTVPPLETIVVDSSSDGTNTFVRNAFPAVELIHYPNRKYCGEARNIAIAASGGDVIALLDADCTAAPDWIEMITKSHSAGYPAVGGSIGNANPDSLVGWSAYLQEFVRWMPGTPEGFCNDVAGANMSYDTSLFQRFGPFIEGTYGSDTEFHWRLKDAGIAIRFEPGIRVTHRNIASFPRYIGHEFEHGRDFARVRIRARSFGLKKRLLYALAWPLIAGKLTAEVAGLSLANGISLVRLLSAWPLLITGITAWSIGEACGYIKPRRTSARVM